MIDQCPNITRIKAPTMYRFWFQIAILHIHQG